jgi:D-alanyl-D-alanine carboxypeptidase
MRIRTSISRHFRKSFSGLTSAWLIASLVAASAPAYAGPALLIDVADGRVLYAEDQDHRLSDV